MKRYKIKKIIYSYLNKFFNFKDYFKYKKLKDELVHNKTYETVDKKIGYKFLETIEIDEDLKNELTSYITSKNIENAKIHSEKKFMINVLNDKDLFKLKNLTRFALSEKILYLVANYLEELPFLANIFITIGQPNETKTSSQLYHLDTEAEKNLKLFFYLSDVDDESGPFTFINKIDSMKIIKNTNYDGKRLEDSSIFSLEKNSQINENRFISNSGKGLAIDTANCLHYGSRNNKKDRIVLILYFTTHFTSHYYKHDLFKKINKSNLNKIQDGVVSHFNNEIFTDKKYLNTK